MPKKTRGEKRVGTLDEYRARRDFERTAEPPGHEASRNSNRGATFVVQKHDASRLHYDFRLEIDGVLKSWAVPKGPSLDPADKRLAVHVEDHPLGYGEFEGVIPERGYGGGTVMLWDRGRWIPRGDPVAAYRRGKLDFELHGRRLSGAWALVRMSGPASEGGKNWLLMKKKDAAARSRAPASTRADRSVVTGRTIRQIQEDRDRVCSGEGGERTPGGASGAGSVSTQEQILEALGSSELALADLPREPRPQLATLVAEAPDGADWLHEIKFDGYRILARVADGGVRLISRNGKDWTRKFPEIAGILEQLPVERALIDGEVVALTRDGASNFQRLQEAVGAGRTGELVYEAFDLLYLGDRDLASLPLAERKAGLARLLALAGLGGAAAVRYTEHLEGNGPAFFDEACRLGLEGIVSKRRAAPYRAGRGPDWQKVKCTLTDEFVVGGFSEPGGARTGFGALLLGGYTDDGRLVYAGKVGTGFSERLLQELERTLRDLEVERSPFEPSPHVRGIVHWVDPRIVVEVEFTEWTAEGLLRHPAFRGVREDRDPEDIRLSGHTGEGGRGGTAAGRASRDDDAEVAGIRLTNPDRILYPEQGVTKQHLAQFYQDIEDWIMPHLRDRPLSLVRCPEGAAEPCFFQKHPGGGVGEAVRRVEIEEEEGPATYLYVDSLAGLIALVQLGVLEVHVWGSRVDELEHPDQMIFDLDPGPGVPWPQVIRAARGLRQRLADLGLASFVKTTGGKGLHVVVPLSGENGWPEVKAFARAVAEVHANEDPERFTTDMSKARRRSRIYVDYLRNSPGATAITPYSTRAHEDAPISVPVRWEELSTALRSNRYTIDNLRRRLASLEGDPWEGFDRARRAIHHHMREAVGLT
jgi:bifunctional non-homologous end joining protein LigD